MESFFSQGKFADSDFKFLSLFLFNKILRMSLLQFHLIMTFLDEHLKEKLWQFSTMVELIGTSISSKLYQNSIENSIVQCHYQQYLQEYQKCIVISPQNTVPQHNSNFPLSRVSQKAYILVFSDLHISLNFRKVQLLPRQFTF